MNKYLLQLSVFLFLGLHSMQGQEQKDMSYPLLAHALYHDYELKPVLIGAVPSKSEEFFKVVSFFDKQEGIFVHHYCSTEYLIEMVYDEKIHGDLKTYLNKVNKQFPHVSFYIKNYQPLEKISNCSEVIKNNF